MACLPPSPSTSVPSCSQVPSSPAPIKLNWLKRRDKDTLLPIIRAHILPGTRVMSDKWKAYDCLQDEGYQQRTVNHSLNFVDPDTGAHTQGIENTSHGGELSEVCPVQEHPNISSKATYMSNCGVSIMEGIRLETSSSISPNFTRCTKTRSVFTSKKDKKRRICSKNFLEIPHFRPFFLEKKLYNVCNSQRQSIVWRIVLFYNSVYA